MMIFNLDTLDTRTLQKEAALALVHYQMTVNEMAEHNKKSVHDSKLFYKSVIQRYIDEYGNFPSVLENNYQ